MSLPPPIPSAPAQRQFPCKDCGANLVFEPGSSCLKCPYCGAENQIALDPAAAVVEHDFLAALHATAGAALTVDVLAIKCTSCGAESSFKDDVVASKCTFCGFPIVATGQSRKLIKPQSLLPFAITREQAGQSFRLWVASLWFAPNDLKTQAERSGIDGAYIPAWTYDSDTFSQYTGARGDNYWETETYYETDSQGRSQARTRQVMKTRWTFVSGNVFNRFDDVLVLASHSLPPKLGRKLQPWDLPNLTPYQDEFISGFVCESYQVGLEDGFGEARQIMDSFIRTAIMHQIGGDQQRIDWVNTNYNNITFKHILLPLWISAYLYRERSFRFLVNARTGQVQGERPYSAIKITILVVSIVLAILILFLAFKH